MLQEHEDQVHPPGSPKKLRAATRHLTPPWNLGGLSLAVGGGLSCPSGWVTQCNLVNSESLAPLRFHGYWSLGGVTLGNLATGVHCSSLQPVWPL